MRSYREELFFNIPSRRSFVNITSGVEDYLKKSGVQVGNINALKLQNMVPQYNRFLKPLGDFKNKFFQMVSAQYFL